MTKHHKLRSIETELATCKQKLYFIGHPAGFVTPPLTHFNAAGKNKKNPSENKPYFGKSRHEHQRGNTKDPNLYWPTYVVDPSLLDQSSTWADVESTENIKFHTQDGLTDRKSHHGPYQLVPFMYRNGKFDSGFFPINPVGKTGISGRGQLGKWGPNHAADPILTTLVGGVLSFVSIQRKDTKEWGLPGGMVEPGSNISKTVMAEFTEEAMNSLEMTHETKALAEKQVLELFAKSVEVYRGYIDDPRNTDNAWMETVAMHVHIDESESRKYKLHAGDDASEVVWQPYTEDIKLYASHKDFIEKAVQILVDKNTPGLPRWIVEKCRKDEKIWPTSDWDPAVLRR